MRRTFLYIISASILIFLSGGTLHAQRYPERKFIRAGNKHYEKGNYPQGEVEYKRALEKTPDSYEADFNLGNVQYKQERYDEAAQTFKRLAADSTRADHAAVCHYNAGNAYFQQRKLQEALEEYKSSLRLNPSDEDAKFNLAYVKKLLKNDENGGGGGGDQNQDQNKDQQDQNQDSKDQQDKGDNKKGNDDSNNDQKPKEGQSGQQQGISREEAAQMLQAIQAQENKTQEKIDKKKKVEAVKGSKRNW